MSLSFFFLYSAFSCLQALYLFKLSFLYAKTSFEVLQEKILFTGKDEMKLKAPFLLTTFTTRSFTFLSDFFTSIFVLVLGLRVTGRYANVQKNKCINE